MSLLGLFGGDKSSTDTSTRVNSQTKYVNKTNVVGVGSGVTKLLEKIVDTSAAQQMQAQQNLITELAYNRMLSARVSSAPAPTESGIAKLSIWAGLIGSGIFIYSYFRKKG